MRRIAPLLLIAACLAAVGFSLLQLEVEHISTGHDTLFEFVGGLGLFVLFVAFIVVLIVYAKFSFRLTPLQALTIGLVTAGIGSVLWRVLVERVSVHSWNFVLLALPAITFISGLLATVIGGVRLFRKYMKAQTT